MTRCFTKDTVILSVSSFSSLTLVNWLVSGIWQSCMELKAATIRLRGARSLWAMRSASSGNKLWRVTLSNASSFCKCLSRLSPSFSLSCGCNGEILSGWDFYPFLLYVLCCGTVFHVSCLMFSGLWQRLDSCMSPVLVSSQYLDQDPSPRFLSSHLHPDNIPASFCEKKTKVSQNNLWGHFQLM